MSYNLTALDYANDFSLYFNVMNDATGGFLALGLLGFIFISIVMASNYFGTAWRISFIYGSASCSIIAVFMYWNSYISQQILILPIIALMAGILIHIFGGD